MDAVTTIVDLTDLVGAIIATALGLAAWVIKALAQRYLGIEQERLDRLNLEAVVDRAAAWAVAQVGGSDGKISIDAKSEAVARGVEYLSDGAADLIQRLGGDEGALRRRLEVALAKHLG